LHHEYISENRDLKEEIYRLSMEIKSYNISINNSIYSSILHLNQKSIEDITIAQTGLRKILQLKKDLANVGSTPAPGFSRIRAHGISINIVFPAI